MNVLMSKPRLSKTSLVIYQTRKTVYDHISINTEKRVENTTRSGLFLTKFEVFGMWLNTVLSV